jgi:hypothetical protein
MRGGAGGEGGGGQNDPPPARPSFERRTMGGRKRGGYRGMFARYVPRDFLFGNP